MVLLVGGILFTIGGFKDKGWLVAFGFGWMIASVLLGDYPSSEWDLL